jgi:hypothetical protein
MSSIDKQKCDNCGKETYDKYEEIGWIQFVGGTITVSKGRKPDRCADSKFINLETSKYLDFCCLDCLVNYIKAEPQVKSSKCVTCGKDIL